MARSDRPGFVFGSDPSPEVSAYLRQKGDRPAFRWTEVWAEEHAHAFTVAKAVQADVLATLRESLQWAIDKGVPYETWSRELKPELQRLGWWGQVEMADPATGEVRPRELGSPRRLRTIYDANLRSARAAGQWERGQRTKAVLPFYLYQLGPSVRHRDAHVAKEGMVLPVDDPIWTSWFPPNGWGCKCWLRQITRSDAERRGVTPPFEVPTRTFRRMRDDGTVERVKVPEGIDPGWHTNPGLSRSRTLMTNLTDRLASAGEPAARALMADFWKGSTPEALARLPRPVPAPAAIASPAVMNELGVEDVVVRLDTNILRTKLTPSKARARPTSLLDAARIQAVLDAGQLVERRGDSRAYVADQEDGPWLLVIARDKAGLAYVASFYPITPVDAAAKRANPRLEG